MSRRSGASKQSQPSPVPSHAGRGRGRGQNPTVAAAAPPPSPNAPAVTAPPPPRSAAAPSPGNAPPPTAPATAASSSTAVESLSSVVEKQLTLAAPSSARAYRIPDRPGYGKAGRRIQVRANHFQVQVAERDLYHYDVSFKPEIISKYVCRKVISLLIQMHRESMLGNRIPAYDGRKSLFSAGPFPFESKDFMIKLEDDDESGSSTAPAKTKRVREYKVTIRFASKTDVHHLNQFLNRRQLDCPYETIQALDVVLRATPTEMYNVVGRLFYHPFLGETGTLGSGTEYWRGYYQSLRPTQMGLSLNIDVSANAYYEPIPVIHFINKHFNFDIRRPLSDQARVKIRKSLKGVRVECNHGQNIRRYRVAGVTKESLKDLTFLDGHGTKKSVVEYFHEQYNIMFQYLSLPALQAGSDTKPIYLPMEVCHIVAGQRYTKRLNEEQVSALLKATCQRPRERENNIKQVVRQSNFNADQIVRQFGIQVRGDPALIDARVLTPPMLLYHQSGKESRVEPRMGQWNMIDKKMIKGGNVQYWTCLNLSMNVSDDMAGKFCDHLAVMCTTKGMQFNRTPLLRVTHGQPNQVENVLVNLNKQCMSKLANTNGRLQLLIIILPDVKGSYGKIKRICETELGIVSQCCQPRQIVKSSNKQYLENVALKINVKVGGSNTVLNDAIAKQIPHVSDKATLILGADVTHPQPGEDSSPSIAAVVGCMDWPWVTKYRGVVSAQPHREEIIQDLFKSYHDPNRGAVYSGIIRDLLMAFRRSTNRKPDRIIFYRDGVSEGQFSQVLLHEMDAIRKACGSLQAEYFPPVTFVVVQKRHHTRLFPFEHGRRDQTDRSGNIMPGTVVDTSICHPREFDFYLNSHAGIQGTSRPTHYHVLYDENNFTADELQNFTNSLCYTYARCTRSVSIVPPAYYAHLAAFRARCYIEGQVSDADSSTETGGRRANFQVVLPSVKDNVADVMFFC